ncbi:DNA-processing protein DprA [Microbacterium sp.]|uniref:DNA-processing protein DprA n=1 Tax=Microbacterium sp. TaxID=51671 RepID=UPI003340D81F
MSAPSMSIAALLSAAEFTDIALRLRPSTSTAETIARATWSVLIEPGDRIAGALIQAHGPIDALRFVWPGGGLCSSEAWERAEISAADLSDAVARWRPRADAGAIGEALRGAVEVGASLLFPGDRAWPVGVDDLGAHAPVLLWVRGDPQALGAVRPVAIVGARASTSYGEHVATELAGDLAAGGAVIVSGGAYGIDGAAHRAALGAGGRTVAFLAGGVDRLYPAGHRQLFGSIQESGAIMSEVPCGGAPTKWRFLQRNRLIAATGVATVVVEAGRRSGSLNTAAHAAALARPLGAVPGPVTSASSAGTHRLMREFDATCVTTAAEVRELWGEQGDSAETVATQDPDRRRLLDAMSTRMPLRAEEIARRAGLSFARVSGLLGLLELEEGVSRREGGWVCRG